MSDLTILSQINATVTGSATGATNTHPNNVGAAGDLVVLTIEQSPETVPTVPTVTINGVDQGTPVQDDYHQDTNANTREVWTWSLILANSTDASHGVVVTFANMAGTGTRRAQSQIITPQTGAIWDSARKRRTAFQGTLITGAGNYSATWDHTTTAAGQGVVIASCNFASSSTATTFDADGDGTFETSAWQAGGSAACQSFSTVYTASPPTATGACGFSANRNVNHVSVAILYMPTAPVFAVGHGDSVSAGYGKPLMWIQPKAKGTTVSAGFAVGGGPILVRGYGAAISAGEGKPLPPPALQPASYGADESDGFGIPVMFDTPKAYGADISTGRGKPILLGTVTVVGFGASKAGGFANQFVMNQFRVFGFGRTVAAGFLSIPFPAGQAARGFGSSLSVGRGKPLFLQETRRRTAIFEEGDYAATFEEV